MKNKQDNEEWYFIEAKDDSRRGYWMGKNKEDACLRFGLGVDDCFVERVEWSGEEFVEPDRFEQGKLL